MKIVKVIEYWTFSHYFSDTDFSLTNQNHFAKMLNKLENSPKINIPLQHFDIK